MNRLPGIGWASLGLLSCLALGGCARPQPQAAGQKVPEVLVSLPVSKEITDYEDFAGRLEADQSIQIRARVTGYLDHVYFKDGATVEQGTPLFEINPRLYEAEFNRAQAAVNQSEAHLQRLERDWKRAQELLPKNAIGREEYDKIYGDRLEAVAGVKLAKANLEVAKVNLGYTKVAAPIKGRLSRTLIDPGNMVKADDTVLTTIGSVGPIKAYFDVDERTVQRVQRLILAGVIKKEITGVPVWMGLADEEGRPHKGTIDFLDNYVDSSTGTLRVRGIFPNPDELFVPGMFVRVRLPIGTPRQAILIAEQAVLTDQGQKSLFLVNDKNEVEPRQVKLGRLHDGLRVVTDGLKSGERVVVSGLQRIRPGAKVAPKITAMPVRSAKTSTEKIAKK